MEVTGSHILKALIDHGKEVSFQLSEKYSLGLYCIMIITYVMCGGLDFKKTNTQKCIIMITASPFKRIEVVHISINENKLMKWWCNQLLDHQTVIQMNEAEPYVMIWKDAQDILLSAQKAYCKTKCLVKIFVYLKTKKKKIYRAYIHTHTCMHIHVYLQKQRKNQKYMEQTGKLWQIEKWPKIFTS